MNSACLKKRQSGTLAAFLIAVSLQVLSLTAAANDSGVDTDAIQQQVNQIKNDESNQRERVKQDERAIQLLEEQLQQLRSQNAALVRQADTLEVSSQKLKADTAQLQGYAETASGWDE
jgi:septal ring factor EnvC (AmiA/AmiB activator)